MRDLFIKKLGIIFSLSLFILFFQNCGDQVDFSSAQPSGIGKLENQTTPEVEEELDELIDQLPKDPDKDPIVITPPMKKPEST